MRVKWNEVKRGKKKRVWKTKKYTVKCLKGISAKIYYCMFVKKVDGVNLLLSALDWVEHCDLTDAYSDWTRWMMQFVRTMRGHVYLNK